MISKFHSSWIYVEWSSVEHEVQRMSSGRSFGRLSSVKMLEVRVRVVFGKGRKVDRFEITFWRWYAQGWVIKCR